MFYGRSWPKLPRLFSKGLRLRIFKNSFKGLRGEKSNKDCMCSWKPTICNSWLFTETVWWSLVWGKQFPKLVLYPNHLKSLKKKKYSPRPHSTPTESESPGLNFKKLLQNLWVRRIMVAAWIPISLAPKYKVTECNTHDLQYWGDRIPQTSITYK